MSMIVLKKEKCFIYYLKPTLFWLLQKRSDENLMNDRQNDLITRKSITQEEVFCLFKVVT